MLLKIVEGVRREVGTCRRGVASGAGYFRWYRGGGVRLSDWSDVGGVHRALSDVKGRL